MKIKLTPHDLKTLEELKDGWSYRISTIRGDIVGSGLPDKETALEHAESNLLILVKKMLKKN
jgi:hypothetical protein